MTIAPIAHASLGGTVTGLLMVGLFFAGGSAAFAAFVVLRRPGGGLRRAAGVAIGSVAAGCFVFAAILPLFIGPGSLARPSSTARLSFVVPSAGELIRGDPAAVDVTLDLTGATIVPFSAINLAPDQGHIHLYLDGSLVTMSGLSAHLLVLPGDHTLRAEFVAADHGPFRPRVAASVMFEVAP